MSCKNSHLCVFGLLLLNLHFIQARNESKTFSLVGDSSRTKRQLEVACLLPDHPPHGELNVLGADQQFYSPNSQVIANTIIDLSCAEGYATETGGLARAICYRGAWTPSLSKMGGCVQTCPLIDTKAESMTIKCVHDNPKVTCAKPIEGTRIEIECKPFYEDKLTRLPIICRRGSWDSNITPCQLKCGQKRESSETLASGLVIRRSEFPWVAAIYKESSKELMGAASILSPRHVLSDVRIFANTSSSGSTNDYIIAAGKLYWNFEDERDVNVQTSKVKHLYISKDYKGVIQNVEAYIVVVTLETPFVIHDYVQPVCIDWNNKYKAGDLRMGNEGIVAGWGLVHGSTVKELQALTIPYRSCNEDYPIFFKYFTYDKICAGRFDIQTNATICPPNNENYMSPPTKAYAGSGLYFRNSDSRFYLRGILGTALISFANCTLKYLGVFTEVKDISDLLRT